MTNATFSGKGANGLLCWAILIGRDIARTDSHRRTAAPIVNRLVREIGPMNPAAPEFPLASSAVMPLRVKAEAQGKTDFSWFWSGQNASGCKEVPAAELTGQLAEGIGSA